MSDKNNWICRACKWEGHVDDIRKRLAYAQTEYDPEEWEWYCPDCNKTETLEEKYENAIWCRTCEDEIVQHEGDQCTECYTEECERYADASRGH